MANAAAQTRPTPILTVRNVEQAAAWIELDGQISDGQWENVRPYDHYKVWCDAEVKVAVGDEKLGRNFYAMKDNYNFSEKSLLDVVGLRMLGIVRIARRLGLDAAKDFEFKVDCDGQLVDNKDVAALVGPGGKYSLTEVLAALNDDSYKMRDLRRDLNDLKQIVRMRSI